MFKNLVNNLKDKFKQKNNSQNEKNESTVFIYNSQDCEINPKYISPENYALLVKFEQFIKNHENLTKEEVDAFLDCESCEFLNHLNKTMPNFVDDLRKHGAKSVAITYVSDLLYSDKKNRRTIICEDK